MKEKQEGGWMLLVVVVTLLFFVKLLSAQLLIKSCLIWIRQILQYVGRKDPSNTAFLLQWRAGGERTELIFSWLNSP